MTFTKDEVRDSCRRIAPTYGFDPDLIFAICLQEGATTDNVFDPAIARLEQGFYRRYVEPLNYATTSEVLLSASFGVMQMMGESLLELGFFEWYYESREQGLKNVLDHARSELAIPNALDWYCVNLDAMVEWGTKWFDRKYKANKDDVKSALLAWNGGANAAYADSVMQRLANIKKGIY
jgi:hypothetical protein